MKKVLDPCCGGRMFYFDKSNEKVLFADNRQENDFICSDGRRITISPDIISDFRNMPFDDKSFKLIIFDPPHFKSAGPNSYMAKKYGKLNKDSWRADLSKGFNECWRVLDCGGTLIFKWNETQIKLREVLQCFSKKPLFGHTTTQSLKTHWIVFFKHD